MYKTGAIIDKKDERDYKITKFLAPIDVPKQYDLTHIMGSVRDQGQEGTCVAFAVSAVKEAEEIGEGMMSPRFIYERIRQPEGGSYPRDAMKVLADIGICPESCQPYIANHVTLPCDASLDMAKPNKIKGYARLTTLQEMKQCLFQNGPFLIAVGVSNNWFATGADGIIKSGGDVVGYHAITFVGYDDVNNMVKIKNSWGEGWGERGYGYMTQNNLMMILTDAWSSIDIPESEEEKYILPPVPVPLDQKNWLQRLIDSILKYFNLSK